MGAPVAPAPLLRSHLLGAILILFANLGGPSSGSPLAGPKVAQAANKMPPVSLAGRAHTQHKWASRAPPRAPLRDAGPSLGLCVRAPAPSAGRASN